MDATKGRNEHIHLIGSRSKMAAPLQNSPKEEMRAVVRFLHAKGKMSD